jgi:hypothetical protein
MKAGVSRALMSLATYSLGESRRGWARAMEAEYEAAIEAGEPFAFAAGCLIAAWREIPRHAEGRLGFINHALALGLLVPMAVFQVVRAIDCAAALARDTGATPNPYLIWSHATATPVLLILWLLLGIGHLSLAWMLMERDWVRVVKVGAMIGAAALTLVLFMGVLFLDVASLTSEAAALSIELAFILATARGHARLIVDAAPDLPAWS